LSASRWCGPGRCARSRRRLRGRGRDGTSPAWTSAATNGLVVDLDYEDKAPYAFTGTVKEVVFDLKPGIHDDEISLHHHAAHHAVAAGVAG
jgi:hypothetical protein